MSVIVFTQENSDAFLGFQKKMSIFWMLVGQYLPFPHFENNIMNAIFLEEIGYLRTWNSKWIKDYIHLCTWVLQYSFVTSNYVYWIVIYLHIWK